jgi:hypothetical protein
MKAAAYGIGFGTAWAAGASASIIGFDLVQANIAIGGSMDAAYLSGNWNIKGKLTGSADAQVGCDGPCNEFHFWYVVPCGGAICASVTVDITYASTSGFDFNVSL